MSAVRRNKERLKSTTAYSEMLSEALANNEDQNPSGSGAPRSNPMENLLDLREYDLPLHVRVSIDKSIFVGSWYQVLFMS